MNECRVCLAAGIARPLLDLGPTPVAHRYLRSAHDSDAILHPLAIDLCERCGLIQISDPIPPETLYKDYNFCFSSWKPQPHTRAELELLREVAPTNARIFEIGANDGMFLKELQRAGFRDPYGIEPNPTSAALARESGFQVTCDFFNERSAAEIRADTRDPFDLIVSRQVVEHIPGLHGVMKGIRTLLAPGGRILIEVPDFEVPLANGDCSSLWEEHVNYFSAPVLERLFAKFGFAIERILRFDFCAGAIAVLAKDQGSEVALSSAHEAATARVLTLARDYPAKVSRVREKLAALLSENRSQGRRNVIYGAGCRSNSAINGLKLGHLIDNVLDDQLEKQGLFYPGFKLPIEPGEKLLSLAPATCFLAVNAECEAKVIEKHRAFESRGGAFVSLTSPSPRFLY